VNPYNSVKDFREKYKTTFENKVFHISGQLFKDENTIRGGDKSENQHLIMTKLFLIAISNKDKNSIMTTQQAS
jgi:hypothetical protein